MGWFSSIFGKKKKSESVGESSSIEDTRVKRDEINIRDAYQREKYIRNCFEQINEACAEIDTINMEYNSVTSYLLDIEELEALPAEEKADILECAARIDKSDRERASFQGRTKKITDAQYAQMERLEDEMPECYDKIKKEEERKVLIKQDLSRLEGERQAFLLNKDELNLAMANEKGLTIIVLIAMVALIIILFFMQTYLKMDVKLGYLLSAAVAAIFLTFIFMKYTEASMEIKKVEKGINKLILLQNRVKIRYVNNSQLLDYLYLKYEVKSSKEMLTMWENYCKEREERKRYEHVASEYDRSKRELLYVLKRYQLTDPHIWLHQTAALLNSKEMVEIRHELILRRQKLRKQIEYNQNIGEERKEEIKQLVTQYPEYAKEILKIVSEYDR